LKEKVHKIKNDIIKINVNKIPEPSVQIFPKKRAKKTKSSRMYFTKDTERAIVKYNKEERFEFKNRIYNEEIKYPFEKLAENVLNTFKFSYFEVSLKDVQKEVVSFLVSNIHKFNPRKKTKSKNNNKAFSYFSVIAKNFLILYNNNNYDKWKRHSNIDDLSLERRELKIDSISINKRKELKEFIELTVRYWENNINSIFKKERDLKIGNAIIELFRRHESIESFNKKALYLYIREMTNCKTQNITKVINKMKIFQRDNERQYLSDGTVKI
jgi:hypothetical protein